MYELRIGNELIASFDGTQVENLYPSFNVEHVYVISASVLDYSLNTSSRRAEMTTMMRQMGVQTPPTFVTTWANAGDVSQEYIDKLPDALSDASGKQNVLFLFHGFGNDVSQNGPWPGGVQLFKERVEQLIESVKQAGHHVIWSSLSYRTPNGSNPSAPYNQRLLKPLLKRISPESMAGDDFVYDLYSLTIQHPERIVADGVHPDSRGRQDIRFYTCNMINNISNGRKLPSKISEYFGKTFIFNFGEQELFQSGINGMVRGVDAQSGANSVDGSSYCPAIRDTTGKMFNGPYLHCLFSDINKAGASDVPELSEPSIKTRLVTKDSIFVNTNIPGQISINNLPLGLTGTITLNSARQASDNRIGNFTHRAETKSINGGYSNGSVIPEISWRFTVEDGKIVIDWETASGSSYSYVNGLKVEFDTEPFREIESEYFDENIDNVLVSEQGAAFDLMDTSLMFKDIEGTIPVTNFGDKVMRVNSRVEGVYMYDERDGAEVQEINGHPVLRLANNRFRLSFDPSYTRPVIAHGTQGIDNGTLYWYNRNSTGYGGRKWGVILQSGQYRMFFDNGNINVYGVDSWQPYHSVYLDRQSDLVYVDDVPREFTLGDETYDEGDLGFVIGGYPGTTSDDLKGFVTHFIISDSSLNKEALDALNANQRSILGI